MPTEEEIQERQERIDWAVNNFKDVFDAAIRKSAEMGTTEYEAQALVSGQVAETFQSIRNAAVARAFGGKS